MGGLSSRLSLQLRRIVPSLHTRKPTAPRCALRTACSRSRRRGFLNKRPWRLAPPPPSMKASCSALTCSRSCRPYPQSGLSSSLSGLSESQLLRAARSRSCRRYQQSGLSPYLSIPACPSDVCAAVQASLPICASAVRGFQSNYS